MDDDDDADGPTAPCPECQGIDGRAWRSGTPERLPVTPHG